MILLWCSTSVDQNSQNVLFTLQFRDAPQFYEVDASNRQQDSYQVYIFDAPQQDDAGLQGGYVKVKGIIRGEEIHYGADLPIGTSFRNPGARRPSQWRLGKHALLRTILNRALKR
jgi:hypothetical protein